MVKVEANTTEKVKMNTINGTLTYIYLFLLIGLIGFATLTHAAKPPENILNNGDFDLNLEGWHHWTHADAAALFQTEGKRAEPVVGKKVAYVKISKAGGALMAHPTLSATLHTRERHHLYLQFVGKERKNRGALQYVFSIKVLRGMNTPENLLV